MITSIPTIQSTEIKIHQPEREGKKSQENWKKSQEIRMA
jgi:hypothetical protein